MNGKHFLFGESHTFVFTSHKRKSCLRHQNMSHLACNFWGSVLGVCLTKVANNIVGGSIIDMLYRMDRSFYELNSTSNLFIIRPRNPIMLRGFDHFTCRPRTYTGIILGMGSTNERRRYIVTSSLIGWAHIQNDPWYVTKTWSSSAAHAEVLTPKSPFRRRHFQTHFLERKC